MGGLAAARPAPSRGPVTFLADSFTTFTEPGVGRAAIELLDAAGYDLYGGPTIVVDFGTANTIDAISEKGEYLGGAIFPGIEISMDALFGRAARCAASSWSRRST